MAEERLAFAQKIVDAKQNFAAQVKEKQLQEIIDIAPEIQQRCLRSASSGSPFIYTKHDLTDSQKVAFADHFYIHLVWRHHEESTDLHRYEFRIKLP